MASLVSQLPLFRAALVAALGARANLLTPPGGLPPVQISSGSLAPDDVAAESIMLLGARADEDWATIGPAGRRHDETAEQQLTIFTTRPGGGETVIVTAAARVFAIADEIADTLNTDPTVTATVRNAHVSRWELHEGVAAEVGRWAELKLTIAYGARV